MKNDWLCKCKHSKEDHIVRNYERDVAISSMVGFCNHDRGAIFKGMCRCYRYSAMDNLEYLEQKSVKA
jgi:hypothetical protein